MKRFILIAVSILLINVFINSALHAQGCSDAGVCTIHSIKNGADAFNSKKEKNDLSIGFGYGKGERFTNNYTGYIQYTRAIGEKTSVTGKINYNTINGELANTSGLGDLFLSVNHTFDTKKKWQKSFVVGLKFPLDGSNISKNGIQLPMPYQTSLGTTDLVLAINYSRKAFGATLAVQQPLSSSNANKFLPGDYPSQPLALKYWPTNNFSRKGDIVGRVSYSFKAGEKFSIRPSLLGIYHEANDTYVDNSENRRPIYNSKGLTLNGVVFLNYKLKSGNGFELSFGTPFIVRDQRPDGLTRKFVASLEYLFSF